MTLSVLTLYLGMCRFVAFTSNVLSVEAGLDSPPSPVKLEVGDILYFSYCQKQVPYTSISVQNLLRNISEQHHYTG